MKKIKNVDAIANGAGMVASFCTGAVIGKVVGAVLPDNISLIGKITVMLGTMAISGYIGSKVCDDVSNDTREILESINAMIPEEEYVTE